MARPHSVTHPPCCFPFTLLVVHDAEELKLSLLSTLQKQTNKQATPTGICMDLPSNEVQEELTKAGTTQTKWCLKKNLLLTQSFVLMRKHKSWLTCMPEFSIIVFSCPLIAFFLLHKCSPKFIYLDLNIFLEILYLYIFRQGKKKKKKKTHTHTNSYTCSDRKNLK